MKSNENIAKESADEFCDFRELYGDAWDKQSVSAKKLETIILLAIIESKRHDDKLKVAEDALEKCLEHLEGTEGLADIIRLALETIKEKV